jgi:hypothetical protein
MWLPADFHVSYSLEKALESETHCYTPAQFIAMVESTQSLPELQWFHPVIAILVKCRHSRWVPILDDLKPILQNLSRHRNGLLLAGPKGGRLKPDFVLRTLQQKTTTPLRPRFPTPAGQIGIKTGVTQGLRHYLVSTMAASRVPINAIMTWVGHRASRMVQYYCDLHDADQFTDLKQRKFLPAADPAGPRVRDARGTTRSMTKPNSPAHAID